MNGQCVTPPPPSYPDSAKRPGRLRRAGPPEDQDARDALRLDGSRGDAERGLDGVLLGAGREGGEPALRRSSSYSEYWYTSIDDFKRDFVLDCHWLGRQERRLDRKKESRHFDAVLCTVSPIGC